MNTPLCDFVKDYVAGQPVRMHMPGHKGVPRLGCEPLDITEVAGADVLYASTGVLRESEKNAAGLFGAARTVYSTEGSSLCIRGMLYLAMQMTGRRVVLAARNAHSTFVTATALLDGVVEWLWGGDSLAACPVTPQGLEATLEKLPDPPAAVYVTSPDYLGNMLDVAALAQVCHRHGTLLLVDNAHGAYLKFLPEDRHPITLGADLCCDSAHKTLPVLTGGAYLHLAGRVADRAEEMEHAMSLFASTSPSYLILQSLDAVNPYLAGDYAADLAACCARVTALKSTLTAAGYTLVGEEPLKVTVAPKAYGYTGEEVAAQLREQGVICEFADPDYVVLMLSPATTQAEVDRVAQGLCALPKRAPLTAVPPTVPVAKAALTPRQALFAPAETLPLDRCLGRVLASPTVGCPPAVPVLVGGEVVEPCAQRVFAYYGYDTLRVVKE